MYQLTKQLDVYACLQTVLDVYTFSKLVYDHYNHITSVHIPSEISPLLLLPNLESKLHQGYHQDRVHTAKSFYVYFK